MGGSGGGAFHSSRSPGELRAEVQRDLEQAKLESEVNTFLNERLVEINARDTTLINERLDEIEEALGERLAETDRLLYGGSVAKHTYVDGLSDVDSLVILKPGAVDADTPEAMRDSMEAALKLGLDMGNVESIRKGFAVTVTYKDGVEIQLLAALERSDGIAVSDKAGDGWSFIRPKAFEQRLRTSNREQDGRVVPTVKLAKAIVDACLRDADQPGGYHMEALAIEAFRGYSGPRSNRAMLAHFFGHSAERIKQPIADVTGQSERIDEVFGPANSAQRQRVSAALRRIASRMNSATSVAEWRQLVE